MDEIFRERGHIKLEMFVNEDKATKPIVKKKLTKMMEEIKIEPTRYEIPQLPVKSKFNYKNDFIERERNPNNKGVKPFYNKNNYVYEKQVSVLVVGTSITNQSLMVKKITDETNVTLKMIKCFTVRGEDGKHRGEENIENLLEVTIKKFKPDLILIETLANEISNLDEMKSEDDLIDEMKPKVKFLMKLLKKIQENEPKLKIVVIKLLLRKDNKMKQTIGKIVGEGELKGAKGSTLIVKSLPLKLETEVDQVRCNAKIYSKCNEFLFIALLRCRYCNTLHCCRCGCLARSARWTRWGGRWTTCTSGASPGGQSSRMPMYLCLNLSSR